MFELQKIWYNIKYGINFRRNIQNLTNDLKRINNWIEQNPNVTEPNMYEIMNATIELGKIARQESVAKMDGKYPSEGTDLYALYQEYEKMVEKRIPHEVLSDENSTVRYGTELGELYLQTAQICKTGDYYEDAEIGGAKQQLMCRLAGVGLFIEQQKKAKAEIVYDNEREMQELNALMQIVEEKETHTQCYQQMKNMLSKIHQEYDLSIEAKNKPEQTNSFNSWKDLVVDADEVEYKSRATASEVSPTRENRE